MFKPIIKFNSGIGAILCNKCRVIVKENLTEKEISGRTNILFCDKHYEEFINKTEEPAWVCFGCAENRGASVPEGHCYTVHQGICGICGTTQEVTEPRDFGVTRNQLRIMKVRLQPDK
jgi:hypothetical protein